MGHLSHGWKHRATDLSHCPLPAAAAWVLEGLSTPGCSPSPPGAEAHLVPSLMRGGHGWVQVARAPWCRLWDPYHSLGV